MEYPLDNKANIDSYFGIDFGTTNCAIHGFTKSGSNISYLKYGDDKGNPFPSIVAIDKVTGEVFTGTAARKIRNELADTCRVFSSVKTVIDEDINYDIAGKTWTPVMIATELFSMLKKEVKNRTDQDLNKAVVAIPVGMSAIKRKKIREAAQNAGIKIKSFVSEPTAAFLANYSISKSASNIAIFDWGGGTLDCSVITHSNGKIEELASSGIYLAGDNIDNKLARRIHSRVATKKGSLLSFDDMPSTARDSLLIRCEEAKTKQRKEKKETIILPKYGELGIVNEEISYQDFCDMIEPEVKEAINCLLKTIEQSGVGIANIDKVILVGGSSNIELLFEEMQKLFGEDRVFSPIEKMWCVSKGASYLSIESGSYISNQSIGLIMSDNSYFELLAPNTPLKNWHINPSFGIVDTKKEARFIFSGSKDIDESDDHFRVLEVPTYKFLEETVDLVAFVDEDQVFTVIAGSSMRGNSYRRVWQYLKLKVYYLFPDEDIFEQ